MIGGPRISKPISPAKLTNYDEEHNEEKEFRKLRERNDKEEVYTSVIVPNYQKVQNVPYGTIECESSPRKQGLNLSRIASNNKEKYWRDHMATNIQSLSCFKTLVSYPILIIIFKL